MPLQGAELRDLCNVKEEFPHVKRGPSLEMKTDTRLLSINCGLLRVMCGCLTGHFSFRQLSGGAPFTFTFVPVLRKLPIEIPVTVAEGSGPPAAKQVQQRHARCDEGFGEMDVPLQHVRLDWWISFKLFYKLNIREKKHQATSLN